MPLVEIDVAAPRRLYAHLSPSEKPGLEQLRAHVAGIGGAERVHANGAQGGYHRRATVTVAARDGHSRAFGKSDDLRGAVAHAVYLGIAVSRSPVMRDEVLNYLREGLTLSDRH